MTWLSEVKVYQLRCEEAEKRKKKKGARKKNVKVVII